ncbi:DNA processing protein [Methanophagales archaeon]|nr:DNA processing protein [Methanophagales archaeon]
MTGWNNANKIGDVSQQHKIQIISKTSPNYPKGLLLISDPPRLLHVLGNSDAINKDCIAIVGTRKPTEYGIVAAKRLGALFAENGYVVVSGLADGIDAAAHQGALEANGLTVAVLAQGLNTVYPSKNNVLADTILKTNGALISEYPCGTKTNRSHFVARGRIQSGLSLGVFVVETGVKGGTMHTVRYSKEQKRILILLQHPPDLIGHPKTLGNAQLLAEGNAIAFGSEDDIDLVMIEMGQIKKKLLLACKAKKKEPRTYIQKTLDRWI